MPIIAKQIRVLARLAATSAVLGFAGPVNAADPEFSYNGDSGPAYWSELSSDWGACAAPGSGARQSPIDIEGASFDRSLQPLALQIFPTTVDIFNNGHTVEQKYEATGSTLQFAGRVYELQQFHFHSLSEHAVEGQRGDMELHAVFQGPTSTDKLVIGLLFEVGWSDNPFLQTLIDAGLPKKNGNTTVTSSPVDLTDVLTNTAAYFTYSGSLTTPPCSENVTWIVLAKRAKLSDAQWRNFRDILGNDFRPLQHRNGRAIRYTQALSRHREGRD